MRSVENLFRQRGQGPDSRGDRRTAARDRPPGRTAVRRRAAANCRPGGNGGQRYPPGVRRMVSTWRRSRPRPISSPALSPPLPGCPTP